MHNLIKALSLIFLVLIGQSAFASGENSLQERSNIKLVESMFKNVIAKHDLSKMTVYFSRHAIFINNNFKMDLQRDIEIHHKIYKVVPKITYHFDDVIAKGDKVVLRYTFGSEKNGKPTKAFRSIMIAQIKNNKIVQIWEIYIPYKDYMTPNEKTDLTAIPGKP
ncbi:MAG: ester cyclase [Gammaproteobacteria bacterium]|nr:ester cyclase [Gammaproteobacteria bacterium]